MRLAQARFAQKAELKAPICARMEQVHALQNTGKHRHSMCGIYGHFSRERADIALVEAMGAHLTHRGPDGQGMYCDERLAFGATRLAIIDLSAPSGAIFNEDRTVAVVFNGEIYNYRALRAELERLGHRFATRTDTEVLFTAMRSGAFSCWSGCAACSPSPCGTERSSCWRATDSARSRSTTHSGAAIFISPLN
jgi:hypothetical protein